MNEYKILSFHKEQAQIVVEYNNEFIFSIDLPIDKDGNIPINEALDKHIKAYLPVWALERKEKIKKGLKQEQIQYIESILQPKQPNNQNTILENEEDVQRKYITSIVTEILEETGLLP